MPMTVTDQDEPGSGRAAAFMRIPAARRADTTSADLSVARQMGRPPA
jgi:hypothetical protein